MFAGNVYAETDLDQPTDYSLRYAEDDTEKPQTYCTEGTPYNFSTATSLSDLRSPDAANKVFSIIYSIDHACIHLAKVVSFDFFFSLTETNSQNSNKMF